MGCGGKESHVLKTIYKELIPEKTANIQAKCLISLPRALSTDRMIFLQMDSRCTTEVNPYILDEKKRQLNLAVY